MSNDELDETDEAHARGFQTVPGVGFWTMSLTSQTMRWTPELSRIYGLPHMDEVPFGHGATRLPKSYWDDVKNAFENCIEAGAPYDILVQIERDPGDFRWVRLTGEAIRDDHGDIIGARGAVFDIHALKARLDLAAARIDALESVVDAAGVPLLEIDDEDTIRYGNGAAASLFDTPSEALLGSALTSLEEQTGPGLVEGVSKARSEGGVHEVEVHIEGALRTARCLRIAAGVLVHLD